jgi:TPP-dependent 2-oxoacid decarboxylase
MIRALAGWNDDLTVRSAATAGELIDALAVAHAERDRLVVIEVHTDRLDLPPALAAMTSAMARRV